MGDLDAPNKVVFAPDFFGPTTMAWLVFTLLLKILKRQLGSGGLEP